MWMETGGTKLCFFGNRCLFVICEIVCLDFLGAIQILLACRILDFYAWYIVLFPNLNVRDNKY